MSGRIRTIKPEVLDDEVAASLSDAAWRMWISLWVLADDHGNVRLGDKYLAASVWQDTSREVESPRAELAEKGLLFPYAVKAQRYGHISGWDKHQRVDNAGKARVPSPSQDDGSWGGTGMPVCPLARSTFIAAPSVSHTYFVQRGAGGPIKIGKSASVPKRVKHLQNGAAEKIVVLLTFDFDVEVLAHARFASLRLEGEWFEPGLELLDFIHEATSNNYEDLETVSRRLSANNSEHSEGRRSRVAGARIPAARPPTSDLRPPTSDHERDVLVLAHSDDLAEIHESRVTRRAFPAASPVSVVDIAAVASDSAPDGSLPPAEPSRPSTGLLGGPATPPGLEDGVTEFRVGDPAPAKAWTPILISDRKRNHEWPLVKGAFESAIREATGGRFAIADKALFDLLGAVAAHCPHVRIEDIVGWVDRTATSFAMTVKDDPHAKQFKHGLKPAGYLEFLNEGGADDTPRDAPAYSGFPAAPAMSEADRLAAADAMLSAIEGIRNVS